jgi:hypothetical protein
MPPNDRTGPGRGPAHQETMRLRAMDSDAIISPPTDIERDRSPLRQALDTAITAANGSKLSMKDLTVLSPQIDPFRLDTTENHKIGKWLADTAATLGLGNRKIHLRGLHYMMIGQPKPDGAAYTNTEADWLWLSGEAGKAARWLRYLSFDQIVDKKNDSPTVRVFEQPEPTSYITVGLEAYLPDADDIEPRVNVDGFAGAQPYKIVMVGEKSSLEPVLSPMADGYKADLYLPTGCLSDTLIYQMAKIGAEDGRPMVVLYFSDCDPSGWNMPIEVGRKLQGFKACLYPDLEFEVHRVALTPNQVREHDLPSTPLKDTEKRGDKWRAAMGVEQTEIDALASLRPDLLREITRNAVAPFFDDTLDQRVFEAQSDWLDEAQAVVDQATDQAHLDRLRSEAESKLAELAEQIEAINNALQLNVHGFDLPAIEVPEAEPGGVQPLPLLDSSWSFTEQCKALIDSKGYRNGGGS